MRQQAHKTGPSHLEGKCSKAKNLRPVGLYFDRVKLSFSARWICKWYLFLGCSSVPKGSVALEYSLLA